MTMPYAYVDSPFRCLCGKRMVVEYGQHEEHGELVESHHCLSCGHTYNRAPGVQRRAVSPMSVAEILTRRLAHLDREVA